MASQPTLTQEILLRDVCALLEQLGPVPRIVASFSGSGDSGDMHDIALMFDPHSDTYTDLAKIELPDLAKIELPDHLIDAIASLFPTTPNSAHPPADLAELFTLLAWRAEENLVDWDWVNNDGGDVEITFHLTTRRVEVTGNSNEVVSHEQEGGTVELGAFLAGEMVTVEDEPEAPQAPTTEVAA